jgi:chromosome segregation ATPase
MSKGLIERLRELSEKYTPDTTCEEAAKEIERLRAELVEKAEDAEKVAQTYQDVVRQNVDLRDRIKVLESALKTIINHAHKALEVE